MWTRHIRRVIRTEAACANTTPSDPAPARPRYSFSQLQTACTDIKNPGRAGDTLSWRDALIERPPYQRQLLPTGTRSAANDELNLAHGGHTTARCGDEERATRAILQRWRINRISPHDGKMPLTASNASHPGRCAMFHTAFPEPGPFTDNTY